MSEDAWTLSRDELWKQLVEHRKHREVLTEAWCDLEKKFAAALTELAEARAALAGIKVGLIHLWGCGYPMTRDELQSAIDEMLHRIAVVAGRCQPEEVQDA